MSLSQNTDHVAEAKARLVAPFRGKPKIEGLLEAYIQAVQDLEDVMWDVLSIRTIDGADLPRLIVIGKLIGQPRHGFATELYRTVIKARALANRSEGTGPDIGKVLTQLLGAGAFSFHWIGPATIMIVQGDQADSEETRAVQQVLPFARAAGVRLWYAIQLDPDTTQAFVWDDIAGNGTPTWSVRQA